MTHDEHGLGIAVRLALDAFAAGDGPPLDAGVQGDLGAVAR
jgi:hypothetical protein